MKQGLLIDMDGVIYGGDEMIQGADNFISPLLKNNIPSYLLPIIARGNPFE